MKIFLKGMEFFSYHGVNKEEKILGQRFRVDVEYEIDDDIEDRIEESVSYSDVYKIVKKIMEGERFNLIETIAKRIGDEIISLNKVKEVVVKVSKTSPPIKGIIREAGVEYRRKR